MSATYYTFSPISSFPSLFLDLCYCKYCIHYDANSQNITNNFFSTHILRKGYSVHNRILPLVILTRSCTLLLFTMVVNFFRLSLYSNGYEEGTNTVLFPENVHVGWQRVNPSLETLASQRSCGKHYNDLCRAPFESSSISRMDAFSRKTATEKHIKYS